jgi:hypothetical protein
MRASESGPDLTPDFEKGGLSLVLSLIIGIAGHGRLLLVARERSMKAGAVRLQRRLRIAQYR